MKIIILILLVATTIICGPLEKFYKETTDYIQSLGEENYSKEKLEKLSDEKLKGLNFKDEGLFKKCFVGTYNYSRGFFDAFKKTGLRKDTIANLADQFIGEDFYYCINNHKNMPLRKRKLHRRRMK